MLLVGRKRLLQGGRGATRADLQLALWPPMATAPQEGTWGHWVGPTAMLREEQKGQHFASLWAQGGGNPARPHLGGAVHRQGPGLAVLDTW